VIDDDSDSVDESKPETPTLRQRLHSATGDREAESDELQRRTPDVGKEDVRYAVRKAAGDLGEEPAADDEMARPEDARAVRDDDRTDDPPNSRR